MMEFAKALRERLPKAFLGNSPLPIAAMDYGEELDVKNKAFSLFCKENGLPEPDVIVDSPKSRAYRTTTKRRCFFENGSCRLVFGDREDRTGYAEILEPSEHLAIYRFIEDYLNKPVFGALSAVMNWVVIRGSYTRFALIFNICKMDAVIVRKLKLLSEHLKASGLNVFAAHLYFDPTRSDYYLEAERPIKTLSFKTLYGPKDLTLDLGKFRLKYPVTGFSQINESQIPNLLRLAGDLLSPGENAHLLDLYCGYGLFSFGIGEKAKSSFGVEWIGPSIESAKSNARFLKRRAQFVAGKIDGRFVEKSIPAFDDAEFLLLDPPRKGVEQGVIPALAKRGPERVLHIFCGTDEIPRSVNQWRLSHYRVSKIQPLDLFPGTPHLETLVLLERS